MSRTVEYPVSVKGPPLFFLEGSSSPDEQVILGDDDIIRRGREVYAPPVPLPSP